MLTSLLPVALAAFATFAEAYPSIAAHVAQAEAAKSRSLFSRLTKRTAFDESQLVDVTGQYAFVAPGPDDQRGPCPGLNALANHGYLPHNGVGTIQQFIDSTNKVFGMGEDLGGFLSLYGAIMDGDGTQWSIGGPTSAVPGLLGLIGQPQGISGSHNKYESDVSPTRGDLYQTGNDYLLVMDQWQELYDQGKASDSYDLQVLTDFRAKRYQESIDRNPNFFYGPFTGVIVSPAAFTFIYRFMSNKSAENPEGLLNGEVLKSFFAIEGTDGNFKYNAGNERIPDNWYTRNQADPYTIPFLAADTVAMGLQHLEFLTPGGNTGKVDSYVGLDPAYLSSNVYNVGNLAQGNNALCIAYQNSVQFLPDLVQEVVSSVTAPLDKLNSQFSNIVESLGCPQLKAIDDSQFNQFPGRKTS